MTARRALPYFGDLHFYIIKVGPIVCVSYINDKNYSRNLNVAVEKKRIQRCRTTRVVKGGSEKESCIFKKNVSPEQARSLDFRYADRERTKRKVKNIGRM